MNSNPCSVTRKGISDHFVHQKLMKATQSLTSPKSKSVATKEKNPKEEFPPEKVALKSLNQSAIPFPDNQLGNLSAHKKTRKVGKVKASSRFRVEIASLQKADLLNIKEGKMNSSGDRFHT